MSLVGTQAPAFTLPDTTKKPVDLASFHGKKVVLAFFPAAFTGVCTKEMCALRDSLAQFNDVGAAVLGISVDAPFSNAAFAKQNDVNFPILSDYERKATRAYGVALENFAGLPGYVAANRAVFVVDADGKVTYEWRAPTPGTEPDYDAVRAAVS
jgi:peroxiredoxin